MTANSASFGEIEQFCKNDGWKLARTGGDHLIYEKVVNSEPLHCSVSHDRGKTPSPGRFRRILASELQVGKDDFWECLRTGVPVDRPVPVEEPPAFQHPAWVVAALKKHTHLSDEAISALGEEEAEQMVHNAWAQRRS